MRWGRLQGPLSTIDIKFGGVSPRFRVLGGLQPGLASPHEARAARSPAHGAYGGLAPNKTRCDSPASLIFSTPHKERTTAGLGTTEQGPPTVLGHLRLLRMPTIRGQLAHGWLPRLRPLPGRQASDPDRVAEAAKLPGRGNVKPWGLQSGTGQKPGFFQGVFRCTRGGGHMLGTVSRAPKLQSIMVCG